MTVPVINQLSRPVPAYIPTLYTVNFDPTDVDMQELQRGIARGSLLIQTANLADEVETALEPVKVWLRDETTPVGKIGYHAASFGAVVERDAVVGAFASQFGG